MKKQKLNLSNLKVESFITDLNQNKSKTINGGAQDVAMGTDNPVCTTYYTEGGPKCQQTGGINISCHTCYGYPC